MSIELKQQLKLSQQLVMTPQLQQAIKLLQLSQLELVDVIREEIEQNPLLEEAPEQSAEELRADGPQAAGALEEERPAAVPTQENNVQEVQGKTEGADDIDWESLLRDSSDFSSSYSSQERPSSDDLPSFENVLTKKTSLVDHLMWQLHLVEMADEDRHIASLIIGNLNDDGYLNIAESPLSEIARQAREDLGTEEIDEPRVERVLKRLQTFDPVGVAARDLSECLLIQAQMLGMADEVVTGMIQNHLHNLEKKNYQAIAKDLKVTLDDVIDAVKFIAELQPRPGRIYSTEEPHYITPDIYLYKIGDEFVIVLNEDGIPKLRISNFYRNALQRGAAGGAKEYIQEKLRSGVWLIRSIYQRQRTIYRVMESILKFQRDFFEKGVAFLKPLILRDVAEDIGMHESTVSRVTSNKYVHTPQGIFELKYFFNSGINRVDGGEVASESVKQKIKEVIGQEDGRRPFSDQKIVELLKAQNIDIARRTVAKYREMLGILPSSKRKKVF
jgi:RNA polymerase sigma-54 factor